MNRFIIKLFLKEGKVRKLPSPVKDHFDEHLQFTHGPNDALKPRQEDPIFDSISPASTLLPSEANARDYCTRPSMS